MELIDTHVHLMHDDYERDLDNILNRSREAGVRTWVTPGIDYASSKRVIVLAEKYEGIIPAVGLHPMAENEDLELFRELAKLPVVKAIGEIGMDRRAGDWRDQEKRFRFFLELAVSVNKPVLVHILHDWQPTIDIIANYPELNGHSVWHCFNMGRDAAAYADENGVILSFTAIIARKKMEATHEVIREWPLDKMMLETDGPWLGWPREPWPNEPKTVVKIAKQIADIKGIALEEVAQQTTQTAKQFFRLS